MATSQLRQAILDLKTQIATVSEIAYCAVFNNQIKMEEDGATFDFPKPAVFIEIQEPSEGVQLLGNGVTINDFTFRFSIVMQQLDSSIAAVSPATGMDENLDIFYLRDLIKTALTGFAPTNCSNLQYKSESPDYKHNNIYVYGISFISSYVDTKGSPFDTDSTVWQTGELTQINLNTFKEWLSNNTYTAQENAVIYNGLIYLCTTTNSDTSFTIGNWQLMPAWIPSTNYTITISFAAYQNHIYQCVTSNSDAVFTLSKWALII